MNAFSNENLEKYYSKILEQLVTGDIDNKEVQQWAVHRWLYCANDNQTRQSRIQKVIQLDNNYILTKDILTQLNKNNQYIDKLLETLQNNKQLVLNGYPYIPHYQPTNRTRRINRTRRGNRRGNIRGDSTANRSRYLLIRGQDYHHWTPK